MDGYDARAIEALIPNLRRYARVLVRDADLADDVVQDCLERAVSRFHQFQAGTNLRGWLFTILLNVVRTHARARQRHHVVPIEDYLGRLRVPAAQEDGLRLRDLQRAFARLPERFQEVILLVAVEGLSYEEAAGAIGVPVGTVRSRLSRARAQLLEHLDDLGAEAVPPVPARRAAAEGEAAGSRVAATR